MACGDLLEVQDPSRFTDEDLDAAPAAVAAGAEGVLHATIDDLVYASALLSDEFQHTGTWASWDDIDHGRIRWDQSNTGNGVMNGVLRARFTAQDAIARFDRLATEGTPVDDALIAQAQVSDAWADVLLGMNFCEAPLEQGGTAAAPSALFAQAVTKFTTAIATASAAGATEFERWATAGRARANLYLGNFTAAATDAASLPPNWTYYANFTAGGSITNSVVNLATTGFNNAGGMREKWWSRVDVAESKLMDAYTNELDPRVPIVRNAGELGVDGVTDYYSQFKYTEEGSDIPLTSKAEMRLIEAEVAWQENRLGDAMTILNGLRTAAGLTAVTATTANEVRDVLLNERFAETFMEAHRAYDLLRFNMYQTLVDNGDFVGTVADRAIQFPLTTSESLNNPNIEHSVSARCSPTL
jgi:hypothetical protein